MCNIKKILPKFCYIPYWNTKCSLLQQRETQVDCQKVLQTLNLSGTYQGEHGILSTIYTNLDNRLCVIALTKLCLSSLIIYLQYSLPQNPQHIFFYFCSFSKSFFFPSENIAICRTQMTQIWSCIHSYNFFAVLRAVNITKNCFCNHPSLPFSQHLLSQCCHLCKLIKRHLMEHESLESWTIKLRSSSARLKFEMRFGDGTSLFSGDWMGPLDKGTLSWDKTGTIWENNWMGRDKSAPNRYFLEGLEKSQYFRHFLEINQTQD